MRFFRHQQIDRIELYAYYRLLPTDEININNELVSGGVFTEDELLLSRYEVIEETNGAPGSLKQPLRLRNFNGVTSEVDNGIKTYRFLMEVG